MGGSQHVVLEQRVAVWLETVPLLLEKTNVKHLSLFCHSAGAIYLMNTLYRYRHMLDPRAPMAFMMAPWADAAKSKSLHGTMLSYLPAGMIKLQHGIAKTINAVAPTIQMSSAMTSGLIEMALPASAHEGSGAQSLEAERYGCDNATAKAIAKLTSTYIWAEETRAVNDEGLTCTRKGTATWLEADDYAVLVKRLAIQEATLAPRPQQKLCVHAYFAESDHLVGKGGQAYLEECFRQAGVAELIDFQSSVRPGTGHDSIIANHRLGPITEIFRDVADKLKT